MKQVASLLTILWAMPGLAATDDVMRNCRQCIVVVSESWTASTGRMFLVERESGASPWHPRKSNVAVVLGKAGMAWGLGLAGNYGRNIKHEGDNKAPAGVFKLRGVFGYAAHAETKMPYQQVTPEILCVDDSNSSHYNQFVDARTADKDWYSAEEMRRKDDLYKWGVIVDHNPNAKRSCGSCIFLHIWRGPGQPTIGCTAMAEEELLQVIGWLDPARAPLLVQLPEKVYHESRERWGLPALR